MKRHRDQLDVLQDFVQRGQRAQAAVDAIVAPAADSRYAPYHARNTDPETSQQWAARMNVTYGKHWLTIEEDLRRHGPSTYQEVADRTGLKGTATSTHLARMDAVGIVKKVVDVVGSKVTRNGCMLRVWIPVDERVPPASAP